MANIIKTMVWDKTGVEKFKKFLDLAAHRHKLISGNLANSMTRGYASKDFDFKTEMQHALGSGHSLALKKTDPKHIAVTGPDRKIKIIEHSPESDDDLNGVDVDSEITNLSINQMRYSIGATILQKKMQFLRKAIKGR